ncbi:hypothetical protein [Cupriavidus basilensis]|uniref:hypothetical protein n=1 Tax=Cupriavidus basilensis TaxID=68895 RepID=UPI00157A3F58|nr:hypothetical protein [Cupriavidus basilensis]
MKNLETYMRLALKAQAQARSTTEALGMLKNPAPYIKQANIAAGHQQVNNHTYASASPHTRAANPLSAPNELMGASNGEWLDTRAAGQAGRSYPTVGTVEAVDRT